MAWLALCKTCIYSPKVSLSSNLNRPRSSTASTQLRVLSDTSSSVIVKMSWVAADSAPSRSSSAPFNRLSRAVWSSPVASLYCTRSLMAISTGLFRTLIAFFASPRRLCAAMAAACSGPKSSSMARGASGNERQSAAAAPPMDSGTRSPFSGTSVVFPPWNFSELRSNCSANSAPLSARSRQNCMMSVPGGRLTPGGRIPGGSLSGAMVISFNHWTSW
mmetsp:Transcript_5314/g.7483  ORF Transcript_5314/g.7483 Transcript_5314/m.7483 type:complete len:218 (+) Transcript_5314:451-1104(+)